jgi:hypothetical protein
MSDDECNNERDNCFLNKYQMHYVIMFLSQHAAMLKDKCQQTKNHAETYMYYFHNLEVCNRILEKFRSIEQHKLEKMDINKLDK